MKTDFISVLGSKMETFIAYRESLGYSATTYTSRCKNLDKYCATNFPAHEVLTEDIVHGWLTRRTKEGINTFNGRAGFIRVFAQYLNSLGDIAYILPNKFTGGKTVFSPYIFTDHELTKIFHAIDVSDIEDTFTSYLLSTIFRLIYTCGLRPNEGRNLKCENINLCTGEILITETKKHKERIVVMSDDVRRLIDNYAFLRNIAHTESSYFFPSKEGVPYSAAWLQAKFKAFFALSQLGTNGLLPNVRIYDLRHRFATAVLIKWLNEGRNLYSRLPYLRTYMGHTSLNATAYYIHLLPENLVSSSSIEWELMNDIIPEVELWEE